MGLEAFDQDEAFKSGGPAVAPAADLVAFQTDLGRDVLVAEAVEGQEDDGGALLKLHRNGRGVAKRSQEILLSFGDGDLGSFARHDQSPYAGGKIGEDR